jgi:hypothetical protein
MVFELGGGIINLVAGRRRAGLAGLRRVSVAALIMLIVQYGLGIVLNLYIGVPASDAHAGLMQEIASGPLMLTLHALLGLALLCYVGVLARAGALHRRAGRTLTHLSEPDYPEVSYRSW